MLSYLIFILIPNSLFVPKQYFLSPSILTAFSAPPSPFSDNRKCSFGKAFAATKQPTAFVPSQRSQSAPLPRSRSNQMNCSEWKPAGTADQQPDIFGSSRSDQPTFFSRE